jgi:UDP-N-acetylglucosamine 3-dehydrogenase
MVQSAKGSAGGLLRVGVVGVGVMGANHARVLTDLPGVKLVGIAIPSSGQWSATCWAVPATPTSMA